MNKINRFLLIYMMIVTSLCVYMWYAAFYNRSSEDGAHVHQTQSTLRKQDSTAVKGKVTEKKATAPKVTYCLKIKEGNLVIVNNRTNEVFEYTDIRADHLPKEIKKMLRGSRVFHSKEEVYLFLESYSS